MADDLNTVKSHERKKGGYHHGDLRSALLRAAEAIIRERGVDGFSLREAARRAGVSPAAPTHHFGDARGLLTALATEGFAGLGDALAESDAASFKANASRVERLHAQGRAYVAYALAEPARFDVMWRKSRIDAGDAAYVAAGARAFELISAAVEDRAADVGRPGAEADARVIAAWSMVHGFARLALDGVFGVGSGAAEAAAEALLPAVLERLDV
ncbi:TetR/AcrR family transcriptional regulator [Chelatococcus sambhunathii]|uniref:TetR/AcrR family transcriptional regulator n=1 Tax=Chelatococcus sambhunathii TaxID=363953 RepID=A0ABU1DJU3_9HYPH|nr:TetR/AcrR family transcriptional regulator [Chelatococcus sambhunathii]MDR4308399.1 TetR/AcrR family transcriptional regulator [Chelatococcus sambhunathii]